MNLPTGHSNVTRALPFVSPYTTSTGMAANFDLASRKLVRPSFVVMSLISVMKTLSPYVEMDSLGKYFFTTTFLPF